MARRPAAAGTPAAAGMAAAAVQTLAAAQTAPAAAAAAGPGAPASRAQMASGAGRRTSRPRASRRQRGSAEPQGRFLMLRLKPLDTRPAEAHTPANDCDSRGETSASVWVAERQGRLLKVAGLLGHYRRRTGRQQTDHRISITCMQSSQQLPTHTNQVPLPAVAVEAAAAHAGCTLAAAPPARPAAAAAVAAEGAAAPVPATTPALRAVPALLATLLAAALAAAGHNPHR